MRKEEGCVGGTEVAIPMCLQLTSFNVYLNKKRVGYPS